MALAVNRNDFNPWPYIVIAIIIIICFLLIGYMQG
jgi:hypothetical protein